jgi:hypothetical protein
MNITRQHAMNIGLDMKKVKLPKFAHSYKGLEDATREKTRKSGTGSLAEYLGALHIVGPRPPVSAVTGSALAARSLVNSLPAA